MNPLSLARRLLWPALLAAVVVALTSAAVLFSRGGTSASAPAAAPSGNEKGGVVCFGTVDLEHGVTSLCPLQPGRVKEVLVRENQAVAEGTVLLRLEDQAAQARLDEAKAAVDLAELQLRLAKKQPENHKGRVAQQQAAVEAMRRRLAAARLALGRKQKLAQSKLIDAVEVSAAEEQVHELEALGRAEAQRLADLEHQDVQADVQRAEKELAAAKARRQQARVALDECSVKAPRAGTVLRLPVGPGDVLGGQAGQPAVLFAADGPQVIRATVEQEFARRIKEGMPAVVQDEADASVSWRGKVERLSGWYSQRRAVLHDPAQMNDVRTLECVIVLEPGQPRLRLGQSVRVLIWPVPLPGEPPA